jgi:Fe-S cluster assembly scaffold protein SufB
MSSALPQNLEALVNSDLSVGVLPHSKHEAYTYINPRKFDLDLVEGAQTINEPQEKVLAEDQEKDGLASLSLALNPSFEKLDIGEEHNLEIKFDEENQFESAHFKLEANSDVHSTLNLVIDGTNNSFGSSIVDIKVLDSRELTINVVQKGDDQFKGQLKLKATLGKESKLNINSALAGSKIFRMQTEVHLNGEQSEFELNSVSILSEAFQVHHHVDIRHNSPESFSQQRFSTVLLDKSECSIDGTVYVAPKAQLVNSDQLIKSMLLSDDARMSGKPNLEIYADDVKCAHGNTCGELEPSQIFYLESRGFSKSEAQKVLTRGFAEELIFKISDKKLANEIDELFLNRLSNSLDQF